MEELPDLNDFLYFSQVAKHGGFTSAGRALGIPKSRLSRRLTALETRLRVRLIERSTRRFQLTETGEALLKRCEAMLREMSAGITEIAASQKSPQGKLRIGCSMNAARVFLGSAVTSFLQRYPDVQIEVTVVHGTRDPHDEKMDVILRATSTIQSGDFVAKPLWSSPQVLVAAPALLERYPIPAHPKDLCGMPSMGLLPLQGTHVWKLNNAGGQVHEHSFDPRLVSEDIEVLHQAALQGLGVVRLPALVCDQDVKNQTLVQILPDWTIAPRQLYAVFVSPRGIKPVARYFIDYLTAWFADQPQWEPH